MINEKIYRPRREMAKERRLAMPSMIENPPRGKNNRTKSNNIPIDPKDRNRSAQSFGRRRANTFDPSSGGIGSMLKIASKRFN